MSTFKHDRRVKIGQRERKLDQELMTKAARVMGASATLNPAQKIRVLSGYIDKLRNIQKDLVADFGTDAKEEIRRIDYDISRAIKLIARLKVSLVRLEGV